MALNNQPYLPLYVDDWMNNNKLKLSSPSSHGLMISIMCIMHKEDFYGKILLKQKFKQNNKQINNFALQIAKLTAFDFNEILLPLEELIENKILIIDDDIDTCTLLKHFLTKNGYEVQTSVSGAAGIKKLHAEEYALILCDFRLGDMDAREVLQAAKLINSQTQIIVITGCLLYTSPSPRD